MQSKAITEVKDYIEINFPGHPNNLIYEYIPDPISVKVYTRKHKLLFEAVKGNLKIYNLQNPKQYFNLNQDAEIPNN